MTDRIEWPSSMPRQPWSHQHAAYDRLGRLWINEQPGVALLSGMGTGKTNVAIALCVAYGFRRVLVICPAAMVEEWPDTFRNEAGIEAVALTGKLSARAETLVTEHRRRSGEALFVVVGVESFALAPLNTAIRSIPWECVIVDESQKIKSAGGKGSKEAALLGRRAPYRLIMTGTVLHDKPLDVYGQFRFIDPRIFGTNYARFEGRYALKQRVAENVEQVVGYQNLDELTAKIDAVSFRVPEDAVELPPLHHIDVPVRLTDKTRRLYDSLKRDFALDLGDAGFVITPNAVTKMVRLQQLTSGFIPLRDVYDEEHIEPVGTEKRDRLAEIVSGLDEREPLVVFCRYRPDLDAVRSVAEAVNRPYLEQSGRRHQWREWRARDDNAILGVQVQSGGAGIDLTRAAYGVFYSHTFSLGDYEQAVKRIHRPGQRRSSILYHLGAVASVDTYIRSAVAGKRDIAAEVYGGLMREGRE